MQAMGFLNTHQHPSSQRLSLSTLCPPADKYSAHQSSARSGAWGEQQRGAAVCSGWAFASLWLLPWPQQPSVRQQHCYQCLMTGRPEVRAGAGTGLLLSQV